MIHSSFGPQVSDFIIIYDVKYINNDKSILFLIVKLLEKIQFGKKKKKGKIVFGWDLDWNMMCWNVYNPKFHQYYLLYFDIIVFLVQHLNVRIWISFFFTYLMVVILIILNL